MEKPPLHIIFLLFLLSKPSLGAAISAEGLVLLTFKSAVSGALPGWTETDPNPCRWPGIACAAVPSAASPRVVAVSLPHLNLSGYVPSALGSLSSLRRLDLSGNRLSGAVPTQLSNAKSLHSLFLSSNNFTGNLPPSLCDLPLLENLDLSRNSLSGEIPAELRRCQRIQRLSLAGNRLSGEVPSGVWPDLSYLKDLDLSLNNFSGSLPPNLTVTGILNFSYNSLSGEIPSSWTRLPPSVIVDLRFNDLSGEIPPGLTQNRRFVLVDGNPGLCGDVIRRPCDVTSRRPVRNPLSWKTVVLVVGATVMTVIVGLLVCFLWRVVIRQRGRDGGDLVAVDDEFECEKEELLRATAYVIGKGEMGILYRVVLENGEVVAVRRLGGGGEAVQRRRQFAAEVAAIARVRHPNVVRLRAYCWSAEEKLLVTEFVSHGCLASFLHQKTPLSFSNRLRIAKGTAKGLACIHETGPRRLVHGGIRPCNILLDSELNPRIADLGLAGLSGSRSPSHYLPPEALGPEARPAQAWDVFSFGVLLLELLTGRSPDTGGPELAAWARTALDTDHLLDPAVRAEAVESVVSAVTVVQMALACAEADPGARPRMRAVAEELDKVVV